MTPGHCLGWRKCLNEQKDAKNPLSGIRANIITLEDEIIKCVRKRLKLFEKNAGLRVQISNMKSERKEFENIRNAADHLRISIRSKEYGDWINNEAY